MEKAVKMAGIGAENLVKINVDKSYALDPIALESTIKTDLAAGFRPICVVSALGTTSSTALDPVGGIGTVAEKYGVLPILTAPSCL